MNRCKQLIDTMDSGYGDSPMAYHGMHCEYSGYILDYMTNPLGEQEFWKSPTIKKYGLGSEWEAWGMPCESSPLRSTIGGSHRLSFWGPS